MNNIAKFFILTCLLSICGELRAQGVIPDKRDTLYYNFLFPVSVYTIDLNRQYPETVARIDSVVREQKAVRSIDLIRIAAFSSIEGKPETNLSLSEKRARFIKEHLLETFPFLMQIPIDAHGFGEDWQSFGKMVAEDDAMPSKQQLLNIIDDIRLTADEKKAKIKQLDSGLTYRYIALKVLPLLRRADVEMQVHDIQTAPPPAEEPKAVEIEPVVEPEYTPEATEPALPPPPTPEPTSETWALKTNLLYWAVCGVANVGAEFRVGKHFSVDVPITWSPYTIKEDWKFRTLSVQPEIRGWTSRAMKGHFFGLYTHLAWYNIATDQLDRYQDKDGKTPLWGGGLSYGYALPLKGRWNMEFTIGFGYARLDYDVFYNIPNGALYDNRTKDYWGITRAGINLIYQFNNTKR